MPHRHFKVSRDESTHVLELTLPVVMDPAEFDKLNDAVGDAAGEAADQRWVVDLGQVEYVGSALLGLLVNLRQRFKSAGGRLVLAGLNDQVTKALQTCSLHNLFTIAPTRDEALKKVRAMR